MKKVFAIIIGVVVVLLISLLVMKNTNNIVENEPNNSYNKESQITPIESEPLAEEAEEVIKIEEKMAPSDSTEIEDIEKDTNVSDIEKDLDGLDNLDAELDSLI